MISLTSLWLVDAVIVVASALAAIAYVYATRKFKYWSSRGVFEMKPVPFIGNFGSFCTMNKSLGETFREIHETGVGKDMVGFYAFDRPSLMVRDPTLIKQILVKDFNYFADRHAATSKKDTLGNANLFMIKSPHWRTLRSKLTPVFSSSKMKKMFDLMKAVSVDLDTHLTSAIAKGERTDWKDVCSRYTTDVIGSCVYGLQVNCLNDPDAMFRKCGKEIIDFDYRRALEAMIFIFVPSLVQPLGLKFFTKKGDQFLRNVMWASIAQRIESNVPRNDLIDTLIELRRSQADMDIKDPTTFKFDGDNLVAQGAIFFVAGFETSSATMSFTLYELAVNPEIQTRLREEMVSALDYLADELTYESLMKLPYLDMVLSETLRKYPPLPFLDREALADYKVPGSDLIIENGTPVYVSTYGLHHDAKHFPDPERFDPDRFSEENKAERTSFVYMPFGQGPHSCIGLRFAFMQVKLGLVKILTKYEITPCEDTRIPLLLDPKTLILAPHGGLYLNIRPLADPVDRAAKI